MRKLQRYVSQPGLCGDNMLNISFDALSSQLLGYGTKKHGKLQKVKPITTKLTAV